MMNKGKVCLWGEEGHTLNKFVINVKRRYFFQSGNKPVFKTRPGKNIPIQANIAPAKLEAADPRRASAPQ